MVATDTMKNTVYVIAKTTDYNSLEQYGLAFTEHFLKTYPILTEVKVDLKEHPWVRYEVEGKGHSHGFVRGSTDYHVAAIHRTRDGVSVCSGIRDLMVLKTTQSGFVGFKKDIYTLLPEVTDRLFASNVAGDWTYSVTPPMTTDFNTIFRTVRTTLLTSFFGPTDSGVYSPSVQATMYEMGQVVLRNVAAVAQVSLTMPNIHFLPVHSLSQHGLQWSGDVFLPTDEPHGNITSTLVRARL